MDMHVSTCMYHGHACLQARAVAQPFAYETYRKERIQKKIKESRASKINVKVFVTLDPDITSTPILTQKLPRINRELAVRLSEKKPAEAGEGPLGDQRFAALFTDEAFQIDKESEEYQKLHPLLSRSHRGKKEEDAEVEVSLFPRPPSPPLLIMWAHLNLFCSNSF